MTSVVSSATTGFLAAKASRTSGWTSKGAPRASDKFSRVEKCLFLVNPRMPRGNARERTMIVGYSTSRVSWPKYFGLYRIRIPQFIQTSHFDAAKAESRLKSFVQILEFASRVQDATDVTRISGHVSFNHDKRIYRGPSGHSSRHLRLDL